MQFRPRVLQPLRDRRSHLPKSQESEFQDRASWPGR
jgi:hypothetical protein